MPLTREDRIRNGRKGALKRLSVTADWSTVTQAARAAGPASLEWHERKIDPSNELDPAQRARMAECAREVYYRDLNDASRRARAERKAAKNAPQAPPQEAA